MSKFRRWFIRGVFLFLLCVVGWGWSVTYYGGATFWYRGREGGQIGGVIDVVGNRREAP